MTDMKISYGAVESVAKDSCCGPGTCKSPDACEALYYGGENDSGDAIRAALTYYAAHPDELPQEVVDAVRGMRPRIGHHDFGSGLRPEDTQRFQDQVDGRLGGTVCATCSGHGIVRTSFAAELCPACSGPVT